MSVDSAALSAALIVAVHVVSPVIALYVCVIFPFAVVSESAAETASIDVLRSILAVYAETS